MQVTSYHKLVFCSLAPKWISVPENLFSFFSYYDITYPSTSYVSSLSFGSPTVDLILITVVLSLLSLCTFIHFVSDTLLMSILTSVMSLLQISDWMPAPCCPLWHILSVEEYSVAQLSSWSRLTV